MKSKTKPTLADIAHAVGCSVATIKGYRSQLGDRVYDIPFMIAHRQGLKGGGAPYTKSSPDQAAAKLRLTNAQADIAELAAARKRGDQVDVSSVREDMLRIGGAVKASMLRLESDLPPLLVGLEAGAMQTRIRESTDAILLQLADMTGGLYQLPPSEPEPDEDLPKPRKRKPMKRKRKRNT